MSIKLPDFTSKNWFSNVDDERITFSLTCPHCSGSNAVDAAWGETIEGIGENKDVRAMSFWPLGDIRRIETTCIGCKEQLTVYLGCGYGGRHGEMQCGIVGIRHGRNTLF